MIYFPTRLLLAATVVLSAVPLISAKSEQWTDAQGKTFKGEPIAILGPLAVFKTGKTSVASIRLQAMSEIDCVRLYEALQALPPRAADWANARSDLSRILFGQAGVLIGEDIVKGRMAGRPEPELYLLIFGWHDHGDSWNAITAIRPFYESMQSLYPGEVEAVFFGVKNSPDKQARMITQARMPWLVVDYGSQQKIWAAQYYAPSTPPMIVVVTRNGALVTASLKPTVKAINDTMTELMNWLAMMAPNNARSAKDRQHYLTAVQTVAYRTGHCDPLLLVSPLDAATLQKFGITKVDATISVGANGSIGEIKVKEESGLTPEIVDSLTTSLNRSVFVAAVTNGVFVDGEYAFHLDAAR